MTVTYGFYDSLNGDRKYNAAQMSRLFEGIITPGILATVGNAFAVTYVAGTMNVNVGSGRAWFNNTWTNNDDYFLLTLDNAEAVLHRIDMAILEVHSDVNVRTNSIRILKGTPASSPSPNILTHSSTLNQYCLAEIFVAAGATQINPADITNTVGSVQTPLVTALMPVVDITSLLDQYEAEFNTWFTNLENQLSGAQNTNLQNQINQLVAGSKYNYLINGGFDFVSRQSPTQATYTTYAANTYSADRWRMWVGSGSYEHARQSGLTEVGLTSKYFGSFRKQTNTDKMFLYQIIESTESIALRGKTVTFQCNMKASAAKTIRMGIFQLTSAGTIDAVPSPIISVAGANTVDPTMATNVSIITAAQSKSVTTTMQRFSVTVTLPATHKNLICAVWTDSGFASGDVLYIAEAGLYVSNAVESWKPRHVDAELRLCQRFCYVTPDGSIAYGECGFWNTANSASSVMILQPHATDMRKAPTMTVVGSFRVDDGAGAYPVTAFQHYPENVSIQRSPFVVSVAGTPLTATRPYKLSANNDTSAKLIFDAEL